MELVEETPFRWRVERRGEMAVPGYLFASRELLPDIASDESLQQVVNVAALPGIVAGSYAMPDVHWGYGFPVGGVAATDVERGGVVSPGGVGFDISCGVRLLASRLTRDDVTARMAPLMDALARRAPHGLGAGAVWQLGSRSELHAILAGGARYAVECGHGVTRDLDRCEDFGAVEDADTSAVSDRALDRGLEQVGSLGSGNHFLEVQEVDAVYDASTATAFGLSAGQVVVMIHCGSRGLGHQICTDHVRIMERAMPSHGIRVADRQLACAPVDSDEGRAYLGAMAAAANYGRANRQLLGEATRAAFEEATGDGSLDLVYDISHNLAKIEHHVMDGEKRRLCVHRKGATRALPPGHPDLPSDLIPTGQPVLVPGSMGTASYVLTGVEGGDAFHSTCHGAGRTMSRSQARKRIHGRALREQLEEQGITVRAASAKGLAEEAPFSYKDVDAVVLACEQAGLARRVARLVPLGVVKG